MSASPPIVVTGAAGFIGRRTVTRLAQAGCRVWALDRVPWPGEPLAGVEHGCVDLATDAPRVAEGTLVHLAWNMARADAAGQTQALADFQRLLSAGSWRGVVGLGSAEEYGDLAGRLHEDQAPGPLLSAYGQAKFAAGQALAAWARAANRKAVWLRPFVVYGPGQGGSMAIPFALRCARERIPGDFSAGHQLRDFVHVDDVVAGIVAATLGLPALKTSWTVCNLGRGEPVRLRDVLERIGELTQATELFRFGVRPMRPNEPPEQVADVATAAAVLGWRAQISWQQGIAELCKATMELRG